MILPFKLVWAWNVFGRTVHFNNSTFLPEGTNFSFSAWQQIQIMLILHWSFFQPFFYLFLSTDIFFVYLTCFFFIILLWFVEFLSHSSYTYRSEICITWCFFRAGWEDTLPFFSQVICNYHSVLCGVKNLSVFLSRLWIMVSFTLIILYM